MPDGQVAQIKQVMNCHESRAPMKEVEHIQNDYISCGNHPSNQAELVKYRNLLNDLVYLQDFDFKYTCN